jgi:hypothetical protein
VATKLPWRYVLADLNGSSLGELRAFQRSYEPAISGTHLASCTIRQDDPLWKSVEAGKSMLKVYDSGGTLRLFGPVITDDEQAEGLGAKVTISAADLSWELTKRFFAKDTTGIGTTYTTTDSGAIAFAILALVNADRATGITAGTAGSFVTRTVTYLWKQALQALAELGAIDSSYEWGLRYVESTPGAAPTVYLDLAAQVGSDRTTSVFLEYGTGKANVMKYGRVRTIDQQATRVWALGSGSTLAVEASDSAAETAYAARREDVVSYGDITNGGLITALATANVAVRANAQKIVSLTTFPVNAPRFGVDYGLGDYVSARVLINNTARVNGAVRVWGGRIAIDEVGNEQPSLILTPLAGVA